MKRRGQWGESGGEVWGLREAERKKRKLKAGETWEEVYNKDKIAALCLESGPKGDLVKGPADVRLWSIITSPWRRNYHKNQQTVADVHLCVFLFFSSFLHNTCFLRVCVSNPSFPARRREIELKNNQNKINKYNTNAAIRGRQRKRRFNFNSSQNWEDNIACVQPLSIYMYENNFLLGFLASGASITSV